MKTIIDWTTQTANERQRWLTRPAVRNHDEHIKQVQAIVDQVKQNGDTAIAQLTEKFDRVTLAHCKVAADDIVQAKQALTHEQQQALKQAANNITRFHEAQMPQRLSVETQPGIVCEKHFHPIKRVGCYIPGGSAPLPSTVLMTALPAKIAGCQHIVLCTPPQANGRCHPAILYAAALCGISEIYLVGGAQAIAAMAYGTETIPKVDKIVGPGNAWITSAKALVSQDPNGCAIDMPAGPSEVMVIADKYANPDFIAADLLSQAEHGPDSQVILISDNDAQLERCQTAVQQQCTLLSRRATAEQALQHSVAIKVDSILTAITIANDYAPEHLIMQVEQAQQYQDQIHCAGSVFLGPWAPESMGDYASGTNHVLPTYGYARAYSGLSLSDFMRSVTFQQLTAAGFQSLAKTVITLAEMEGLDGHAFAVKIRQQALLKDEK